MDTYLVVALSIILSFLIFIVNPKIEYNEFILELILEKPYILLLFISVYFISNVSPLLGILYGLLLLIIEYDIKSIIVKNVLNNNNNGSDHLSSVGQLVNK